MKTLKSLRLVAASVLALGVSAANAGVATGQFDATATVVADCLVSATDLAFGNYDPVGLNDGTGVDVDATSTISSTCTLGAGISINIDNGGNFTTTRRMNFNDGSTDYFLDYGLFRNGYVTAWTDTANLAAAGTGTVLATTVEGRVPKGQSATALNVGNYVDTLTVTVTF